MICKEELCALFKNLSPYKRVDYMCSLLHMCLPLEIRFIGSVLEDYGRKDYYYLRDAEIKANTPHEVSRLTELPEKAISSGLNVYLCLLHSSNLACSKLIYEILDTCLRRAFDFAKSTDPKEHEELLLALSLAVHHPAFTFYQKTVLYNYYAKLETHIRDLDKHNKPDEFSFPEETVQEERQEEITINKVVINNIDIRDIKKRPERKAEFRIKITWSNNEQFEITKTPRELQDFQTKLQKLFPNEVDVHKRGWKIPFLHGNTYQTCRDERENPMYTLQQYFSHIIDLPPHVLESDHVTQFFRAGHSVKVVDNVPVNSAKMISHPRLESPPEDAVIGTYPLKSMIVSNSQFTDLMPDELGIRLPKFNTQHTYLSNTKGPHHWSAVPEQSRVVCSKHGLTTSQHRSPAHSPMSSSTDSPSSSRPSSPVSHNSTVSVTQLLKLLNLERYSSLSKYTVEQLASLTSDELSAEGLPKECQHLLQTKLENITRNKSFASKNGMVEMCNTGRVLSPSTNLIWHATPPNMPYPPMPSPVMPCQMMYITSPSMSSPGSELGSHGMIPGSGHMSDLTSQDLSSEYSSTPPSPSQCVPKQQVYAESSGSDDNEKDKGDQEENVCRRKEFPLGQSLLNPGVMRLDELKITPPLQPTYFLEPKPEFQSSVSGHNGYQCDSAHAPVMSTGYPPARPAYIAMRPYKAPQPTHAHMGLPVKSMVNMPQDGQMKANTQSVQHAMYPVQPVRSDYPSNVPPASVNNNVKNSAEGLHRTQPFLMGRPLKGANGGAGWSATSGVNSSTTSSPAVQSVYHSRQSPGPAPVPPNPNTGLPLPPPSVSPPEPDLQAPVPGMPGLAGNSQSVVNTSTNRSATSQSPGPPLTPTSSSNNCDCTCGSCDSYPPTSAYPQFSIVPPAAFWPLQIPPHLLAQGNGIIAHMPPNMYGQIPPNYPNGINPEYLFQNHPNFQHLPPGVLPMSYMYGCNMLHNSVNKQRNQGCYNCGGTNHKVQDCKEKTMESFSGFHLNYKPKSDSD